MTWIAATVMAAGVFVLVSARRSNRLSDRIGRYLVPEESRDRETRPVLTTYVPAVPWVVSGAFAGALFAQGDLFLAGPGRSVPALTVLGGTAGWILWSARRSTLSQRRARQLRFELPVLADALAMQIVSGESVSTATEHVAMSTTGVASDELDAALLEAEHERSFPEALVEAGKSSAHADGRRLYETLAHAHTAGGRLSESLTNLSADFRASLERDLTSEGGKRAIASYGPILALMVPTALLFLLYPTLLGLRALSGAP